LNLLGLKKRVGSRIDVDVSANKRERKISQRKSSKERVGVSIFKRDADVGD